MTTLPPIMPTPLASIKAADPFNLEAAAENLRRAMKGLGTNEDAIIDVLTSHCNAQRLEIDKKYKQMFGRDLREDLRSEISGKFLSIAVTMLDHPRILDASEINDAMKGAGTDEDCLIEILSTRTNEEIIEICKQYKTMYKRELERDIHTDTSGDFKHLLTSLVTGARETTEQADVELAKREAKELFEEAGEKMLGTDESTFNHILCLRSVPQLRETFNQYKVISGHDIEQAIESEMSGNLQMGFLAIVKSTKNIAAYFAERLFKSMKGAGTNDRTLIRDIVSRSEVDMATIKEEFQKMYGKTLAEFIKGDTIGDYRKILLAIVKE